MPFMVVYLGISQCQFKTIKININVFKYYHDKIYFTEKQKTKSIPNN